MTGRGWRFFIDVGGTFTDVVAVAPDGRTTTTKLLSSGQVRGAVLRVGSDGIVFDNDRRADPPDAWLGFEFHVLGDGGGKPRRVLRSRDGGLALDDPSGIREGAAYFLQGDEPAPVLAIRRLLGLRRNDPIGSVDVRLGTTRATNALLERRGLSTAFVTTLGFGDLPTIGYQDRPELFALNIRKRSELAACRVEIDERLDAQGRVLRPLDEVAVKASLRSAREAGTEALAICLLHAHVNPVHERQVARIARDVGFRFVSVSSDICPLEGMVPRADTTIADAYLSGVIDDYVADLRRSLPDARIRLMTSHGGLVDTADVHGKDTVLSGPAGGVVGCAHVSGEAGFPRAIGFDMGGTSTDVAMVETSPPTYEYQTETVKAGVRLMTPMIAVETVAAGGGSVCGFDGRMLTVGPESAGADPGPACYGRGGPLTVTDVNLALGRLDEARFPFALDRSAVDRRLDELRERIERGTGRRMERAALTAGLRDIANEHMAATIKKISLARGYDPADYVLCSYGGAGGQHACAVADLLGMRRILVSPYASVLSAVGIGVTQLKQIEQKSVREVLGPQGLESARETLETMTRTAREPLAREADAGSAFTTTWTLELCYAGQATLLPIACAKDDAEVRRRFEEAHQRLYGYAHRGRTVEIRGLRAEVTTGTPAMPLSPPGAETPDGTLVAPGDAVHASRPVRRESMIAGHAIEGPALITDDDSATVVEPGWSASIDERRNLVLSRDTERDVSSNQDGPCDTDVDPVRLELFNRRFESIAEQMGVTLRRTALSTNVKERLDFSCALFTASGDLVVNAPHIPVHLGAMSDTIKALIADVDIFHPGDVYVTNDPYRGGSHLNDVTVVTPVFFGEGAREPVLFVASRAHHAEIGGTRPGSMPPDSTCLAEEGVLIRTCRWISRGEADDDMLRELLTGATYPSRAPDDNLADLTAQAAANQCGVDNLRRLMADHTVEVVLAYMGHVRDAAAAKMRAALSRLPDRERTFTDAMDDGTTIRVRITKAGDRARVDFTGTDGVHPGNLNANRAIVTSALLYCLRCLIDEDIPLNAGVLEPVELILPVSFLNPAAQPDPRDCPAVVGGNVETSQRIVDCLFGALGTVAASQGTMNNLLFGDAKFGYYETICGGAGAGPGFHGCDAVHTHMTNTRMTDPEVLEARYPVRLDRFTIRRGSGGAGAYRGGDGVIREITALRTLACSILSQRRTRAPYGLSGGGDGRPGRNAVRRANGETIELRSADMLELQPGDTIIIETPGGGGYGKQS